jgi:O-antigen/teichoic acid export membrane protein
MLAKLDGLAATGQYAVGTRFASVLMLAAGAFGTAYVPFVFSLHAADPERERAVRGALLTYASVAFVGLGLLLALFAREVASVIAPAYDDAYKVVGILCLGVAAFSLTPITAAGINIARRTHYAARYTVVSMLASLALCVALIPPFGLVGAALATAASFCGLAVAYVRRSQQLSRVDFHLGKVLKVFLLGAVLIPVGLIKGSEGVDVLLKLAALAAFVGGLWALRVLGPVEQAELRRVAGGLSERERQAVDRATRTVLRSLLHGPTVALRRGDRTEAGDLLAQAFARTRLRDGLDDLAPR